MSTCYMYYMHILCYQYSFCTKSINYSSALRIFHEPEAEAKGNIIYITVE